MTTYFYSMFVHEKEKIIPHGAHKVFKLNRKIVCYYNVWFNPNKILLRHKNNFRVINQSSYTVEQSNGIESLIVFLFFSYFD